MNFMYLQAKKLMLQDLRGNKQSEDDRGNTIEASAQLHSLNEMLKLQIENGKKEADYYKKQMEVFKEQLQIAAMREHDTD